MQPNVCLFFVFFLLSGFCSLIYEIVWLRLAMASFGLNAPLVSTFLSVFMAGLGLGSWLAGMITRRFRNRGPEFFVRFYAVMELILGISSLVVPSLFKKSEVLLAADFTGAPWGSLHYYMLSGALITAVLLPWCTVMGATFPTAMAALPRLSEKISRRAFSFLYIANVTGAVLGTLSSAFVLIEEMGLTGTLRVAAAVNGLIAVSAYFFGHWSAKKRSALKLQPLPRMNVSGNWGLRRQLPLLFMTGAASMGMEVVWLRIYMKFLGNSVYTFAIILATYLIATVTGSLVYRIVADRIDIKEDGPAWVTAGLLSLLPLLTADPKILLLPLYPIRNILLLAAGIMPFCGLVGFLTPKLVDEWSAGDPDRAGIAYAVNVIGCIAGPLLAGFLLLPVCEEAYALLTLALPLLASGFVLTVAPALHGPRRADQRRAVAVALVTLATSGALFAYGRANTYVSGVVLRDYEAVVHALGEKSHKQLLVNGIGMTSMTPITKMMAHLPLAFLAKPPENSLTICFGMGTTFRSFLSWGIQATAVDIVPSVPKLFGYFHSDAQQLRQLPNARIVIDDGRRFLRRTCVRYDAIAIDPPPPINSAYSSLLYSREFYELTKRHLKPGGILQQWIPGHAGPKTVVSIIKSLAESFPFVRVFRPGNPSRGFHLLASEQPIALRNPAQMANRMPKAARQDLVEWGPLFTPEEQFKIVLDSEMPLNIFAKYFKDVPTISDDRPYNEYSLLRNMFPNVR